MSGWYICSICEEDENFENEGFKGDASLAKCWKTNNYYEFEEHQKAYHRGYKKPSFSCHYCHYKGHLNEHEYIGSYNCFSSFYCETQDEMNEHYVQEHPEIYGKLYCEDCGVQCYFKKQYEEHLKSKIHRENANVTFKCEVCDYETNNPYVLKQHNKSKKHLDKVNGVAEKEHFHCEACEFHTPYKSKYEIHCATQGHENKVNGIEKQTEWYCEPCKYTCYLKHHYEKHLKTQKHIHKTE